MRRASGTADSTGTQRMASIFVNSRRTRLLAVAAVSACALLAVGAAAPSSGATAAVVGDCTSEAGWGNAKPDLASQVVSLVNDHRSSLGLAPLAVSGPLAAAADWKARHMAWLE